jgi:hypothetical protein
LSGARWEAACRAARTAAHRQTNTHTHTYTHIHTHTHTHTHLELAHDEKVLVGRRGRQQGLQLLEARSDRLRPHRVEIQVAVQLQRFRLVAQG